MGMPLGRYFAFTGGLLVVLLFLADWCMPKLVATPASAAIDKTIIRIRTAHKWPEAIVIDTSLPTIVPPPPILAAPASKPPPETRSPRDALALAATDATPAPTASPASMRKPVYKRRTRTARVITGRGAGDDMFSFRNNFAAGW